MPDMAMLARRVVAYGIVEAIRRARGSRVSITVAGLVRSASAVLPEARALLPWVERGRFTLPLQLVNSYLNLLVGSGVLTRWARARGPLYIIDRGSELWELARSNPGGAVEFIMKILGPTPGGTGGG